MNTEDAKSLIIKSDHLDFRRIVFNKPSKTPEKFYASQATLDKTDGPSVFLQTPSMTIRQPDTSHGVSKKHVHVDLQITDDSFYQLLRYIDAHIVQHIFQNREAWFSKDISMAAVEDCYKTPISKQVGGNWPLIRMKLNIVDSVNYTTYFVNKKEVDIAEIKSSPDVIAIVQFRGLLMNKESIQPDWVIHMLKSVKEAERKPKFAELVETQSKNENVTK